jgi:hypothetical protein
VSPSSPCCHVLYEAQADHRFSLSTAPRRRARSFNWSLSLLTLLSLIVFVIPLGLSLLLTHRKKSTSAARSLILTLIPFAGYLFLFDKVGMLVASKVVVEGSHSLGELEVSSPSSAAR